ncbi:2`-hydroxyisoflavone reductase [Fusarium albosuccineum]|uniref:2`-hydroxyisoflavone reductase n=1 Tax=Fusarium albosuccineum TaxID=1237068 RepID=A0A8H4L962_9HYPO|nr:2`-hydroxyisoflavone reductase [Fusarium albosuccineum]
MAIQKVAVVGASGTLGSEVVKALLRAGFDVTAITRNESQAKFPDSIAVKRADLSSVDSVKEAISGQDAIVSTSATAGISTQKVIINATIAAKIERFIPSEFGIESRKYRDTKIGRLLAGKVQNSDYLIELASKHDWFSWTGLSTGLFFELPLKSGSGFVDVKNRKFTLVDSGNEPYSTSPLSFIGDAVAAILKKPKETANQYLNVAGVVTTQNELLKAVEEVTGNKFEVSHVTGAELEKIADEKIAKHDYSAFGQYIQQFLFADGAGHALTAENSSNELLGLEKEDVKAAIRRALA